MKFIFFNMFVLTLVCLSKSHPTSKKLCLTVAYADWLAAYLPTNDTFSRAVLYSQLSDCNSRDRQEEKEPQKGLMLQHSRGHPAPRRLDQHVISYPNLKGRKQKSREKTEKLVDSKDSNLLTKRKNDEQLVNHPEDVDPNAALEFLLEGETIEDHGKKHKVQGLHPEKSAKAWGDTHDGHKYIPEQLEALRSKKMYGHKTRNFLVDTQSQLWHNGVVPYTFHNVSSSTQEVVYKAIKQFDDNTCIRWIPENEAAYHNLDHTNVIHFIDESGCWSYVGNIGWYFNNIQRLSMQDPGCTSVATAVHEMYHAIGGMHEQSRKDRDNFLEVLWDNVIPNKDGSRNGNMAKSETQDNNPYDAESAMQYDLFAFTINGQRTMEFKDQRVEFLANSADGLEFYDIQDITDAYTCADHCSNPPACENAGFVNFQCNCGCPDGLSGAICTDTVSNSDLCGGTIIIGPGEEKFIQSPDNLNGLECTWLIKATTDNLVRATVEYMDIAAGAACYHWLEYRYNLLGQDGPKRCGTNFDAGKEVWDSTEDEISNAMMIKFNSNMNYVTTTNLGFKIILKSIGKGCVNNPCVFGSCYSPEGTSFYTCTCDTGVSGTNCDVLSDSAVITCEFEYTDKCFLDQDTNDQFNWNYENDKTYVGSYGIATGPTRPNSGYQYFYMQAYMKAQGDKAVLVNNVVQFSSAPRCMSFYYHMSGSEIGALNVYIEGEGANEQKSKVFSKTGHQGDNWRKGDVNIPAMTNLKIYFEGVVGSGYKGDIALDDIVLVPGACVRHVTKHCGFEDGEDNCIFADSGDDDFDWTRTSGSTPSENTGPNNAFNGTFYKYFEVSSPVKSGNKAVLTTEGSTLTSSPYCLNFHYHMYNHPDTLVISAGEKTASDLSHIWTKSGDQGNNWNMAFVNISQFSDPVIKIVATKGLSSWSWQGDIAIDNLDLKEGPCVEAIYIACDFENKDEDCIFADSVDDDFDWTRLSGETPSFNTGPDSAISGQFYKYIEVSSPIQNGQKAVLTTKISTLKSSSYCLKFQYHMYGWETGTLWIFAGDKSASTLSELWSISGDQGKKWNSANIDIQQFADPLIEIKAARGTSWRGDIAIDNLVLKEGQCDSVRTERDITAKSTRRNFGNK